MGQSIFSILYTARFTDGFGAEAEVSGCVVEVQQEQQLQVFSLASPACDRLVSAVADMISDMGLSILRLLKNGRALHEAIHNLDKQVNDCLNVDTKETS